MFPTFVTSFQDQAFAVLINLVGTVLGGFMTSLFGALANSFATGFLTPLFKALSDALIPGTP
ncbi:MAG: hypothetical protein U1A27_01495 [Phycisphaerae bacterium]